MERQQDLQLAQIESIPGGFGHLQAAYHNLNDALSSDNSGIYILILF